MAHAAFRLAKAILKGRFEIFPPRRIYALDPLRRALADRFGYRGGVFFEAGANDGLTSANAAYLGRYLGWSGILVEPIPNRFRSCVRNRPDARSFHAALVPSDYLEPELEMVFADMMTISGLSELDIAKHVERAAPYMNGETHLLGRRFLAPARTVQSILDEAGNPEIDLFVLDVEGAERSVLDGLDFTKSRPKHMLIEVRDVGSTTDYLAARGYSLTERLSEHDCLFRRDSLT